MSVDISLPNFIKFEELDPPSSMNDFMEVSDKNYDTSFIVKSDSTDKIAQLILVTPDKQKIMIQFNATGRIGFCESVTNFFNSSIEEAFLCFQNFLIGSIDE